MCSINCSKTYPTVVAEDFLFRDCMATSCSGKGCPVGDAVSACNTCAAKDCEQNFEACWADPATAGKDCPQAMFCYHANKPNQTAINNCINGLALNANSTSLYNAHLSCIKNKCGNAC